MIETESSERSISPAIFWAALAAFIALVVSIFYSHEFWRDEVRALSVAIRPQSWGAMLHELRYEGHPVLWYALLRAGYAVTHSNLVLPGMSLAAAAGAAIVILCRAPFPVWLRLLAVFGAFLGYALSVESRNYGIGVMLLMLSCVAFTHRDRKPWLLGLTLLLLANTSIHAAVATLVVLMIWSFDLSDSKGRKTFLSLGTLAGFVIALAGFAFALKTAMPTPDMAWASRVYTFDAGKILSALLLDPGHGLRGAGDANIAAVGELPWRVVNINPALASRLIVDACVLWLLWCIRHSKAAVIAILVTILGYQVFFRTIYTASARHEAVVLFLIFAICWMAVKDKRRAAIGLLPLFVLQSLALPMLINRSVKYPQSNSKPYAEWIRQHPRYRHAVLMSEPDYMMEAMPFYVDNPVYMPRQAEFAPRVIFGERRKKHMTLQELAAIADKVSCTQKQPVLLAIGYRDFPFEREGIEYPLYRGLIFQWSEHDRVRLGRPIAQFPVATTDELWNVWEILGCNIIARDGQKPD